ncbi:MAG TPA: hypothetical protein ENN29_09145 [Candidatus Hydrogenedentes bacterium]|nr:hypothetical protein [Candidatus Hydrogenedentota bacterium]
MMSRCPHSEPFEFGGRAFTAAEIIAALAPVLLEERRRRIDAVIAERTYSVAPVLEGLYDLGNVSAVLRSAEALGFQAVHIVDSSPVIGFAGQAVWATAVRCSGEHEIFTHCSVYLS